MFSRLSTSWELVKASAQVLRSDRHLVIFPIISGIAVLIVSVTFFAPVAALAYLQHQAHPGRPITVDQHNALWYAATFLYYLVQYFVIIFFNTALVGAAMIRLRGGSPTLGDGFRLAMDRIGTIFGYALLSATVGVVLRTLSERFGIIGRIVIGLIGLAWNVATYLAIPVLVHERVGPIKAVKRSSALLKQTWGDQIAGNIQMGAVTGLVALLIIGAGLAVAVIAAANEIFVISIIAIALTLFALLALAVIQAALTGIFTAALYLYAAEGMAVAGFSPDMIQSAFAPKKSRR